MPGAQAIVHGVLSLPCATEVLGSATLLPASISLLPPLYGKPFTLKDDNDEISTLLFCILTAGAGLPFITKDLIVSRCGRESG